MTKHHAKRVLGSGVAATLVLGAAGLVGVTMVEGAQAEAPARATAPAAPADPTGRWTGPVAGDSSRYSVVVTFSTRDGDPYATVSYPQLACSGVWTYRGRSGPEVRFRERITRGQDNCVTSSPVRVYDLQGARMLFEYNDDIRSVVAPVR